MSSGSLALVVSLLAGTLVHLLATDPAAPLDLAAWCHLTGHQYLGPIPSAGLTPGYALRVAADAHLARPDAPWLLET